LLLMNRIESAFMTFRSLHSFYFCACGGGNVVFMLSLLLYFCLN
jgi:hypothetical protein